MLRILNEEDGFEIKERELMRVRAKNRWLLRVPNGMKAASKTIAPLSQDEAVDQMPSAMFDEAAVMNPNAVLGAGDAGKDVVKADSSELSPEVIKKRQERIARLQADSAERWVSRKRRRRTRGWAGLPADPPGPPRFPSETTIDESKAYLNLDSNQYRDMRAHFQRICEENEVIKKTLAGPEKWEAVKAQLVQESPHLQQVMWNEADNIEGKRLALDVVCTDVTKRMRTLERRMTIAEAKNALGINPEESRQIRNAFYRILKADHFTSKVEAGNDHWKDLKSRWVEQSELLKSIIAAGNTDPEHETKIKAMEVLCRDVMKRLRDDQTKRDPTRRKKFDTIVSANQADRQHDTGASAMDATQQDIDDEPVQHNNATYSEMYTASQMQAEIVKPDNYANAPQSQNSYQYGPHDALVQAAAHAQAQAQAQAQVDAEVHAHRARAQAQAQTQARHARSQAELSENMQIDPSLLIAAANDPAMLDQYGGSQFSRDYSNPQEDAAFQHQQLHSIPIYFRLHPSSNIQSHQRMWVATLSSVSIEEIRQLVSRKFSMATTVMVEGIVKNDSGGEMSIRIEEDDELDAYLAGVGGMKPVFGVQVMRA